VSVVGAVVGEVDGVEEVVAMVAVVMKILVVIRSSGKR
jgi:hypothetical protein